MLRNKRTPFIGGNWKMNTVPEEASALASAIAGKISGTDSLCDTVLFVPYIDICAAMGKGVKIGAQNVHYMEKGAFTGEVSVNMLRAIGVETVIIGHSERRSYFGETDETVNLRLKAAISGGLTVVLCVGETLAQRESDTTDEVISIQVKKALAGVSADELRSIVIAYEPVWAIGTGKTATAEQACEVCHIIRSLISEKYGKSEAEKIRIIYGGSMNAANCAELLAKEDIDGGLIGGASLKADDLSVIVHAACK